MSSYVSTAEQGVCVVDDEGRLVGELFCEQGASIAGVRGGDLCVTCDAACRVSEPRTGCFKRAAPVGPTVGDVGAEGDKFDASLLGLLLRPESTSSSATYTVAA